MDKDDARKTPGSLHERRKQVVRLHRKGYGPMAIAELTGLSWGAVDKPLKLYEAGGIAALRPRGRGRKKGTCRSLTKEQEQRVQKLIREKGPEQLKMNFALLTGGAVKDLIRQEFNLELSIRCVGDYLHRWGFTSKKSIKRAYEQQPKAVRKWLEEEYTKIEAKLMKRVPKSIWATRLPR